MTHAAVESSIESGRPVRFYQFALGAVTWRYTSADEAIVAGGLEWLPAAMSDDGTRQTNEPLSDSMSIEGPQWIGPSQVHLSSGPARKIVVTVFEMHEDDPDDELVVDYVGEVTQVNHPMPGRCRITCETVEASTEREGLRHSWQRLCPYTLYDTLTCKVDKALWEQTCTVLAIDGFNVTLDVAGTPRPAGYFSNGFMTWTHPIRGSEFLPVEDHTSTVDFTAEHRLTMLVDPGDLYVGATGFLYPGCTFTPESCVAFSNYANYGGSPYMTGKSPFDGNPVF